MSPSRSISTGTSTPGSSGGRRARAGQWLTTRAPTACSRLRCWRATHRATFKTTTRRSPPQHWHPASSVPNARFHLVRARQWRVSGLHGSERGRRVAAVLQLHGQGRFLSGGPELEPGQYAVEGHHVARNPRFGDVQLEQYGGRPLRNAAGRRLSGAAGGGCPRFRFPFGILLGRWRSGRHRHESRPGQPHLPELLYVRAQQCPYRSAPRRRHQRHPNLVGREPLRDRAAGSRTIRSTAQRATTQRPSCSC